MGNMPSQILRLKPISLDTFSNLVIDMIALIYTRKIKGMPGVEFMYKLESELVKEFRSTLFGNANTLSIIAVAPEFNYVEGRVDLIAINNDGDLVAFEAKLTRWRSALNQAYRNSSFAHYSYVVLPKTILENVIGHIDEFHRRGIGLCVFDSSSGIKVEVPAIRRKPIQPWLTSTAMNYISDGRRECAISSFYSNSH